jgi:hypothetical protein
MGCLSATERSDSAEAEASRAPLPIGEAGAGRRRMRRAAAPFPARGWDASALRSEATVLRLRHRAPLCRSAKRGPVGGGCVVPARRPLAHNPTDRGTAWKWGPDQARESGHGARRKFIPTSAGRLVESSEPCGRPTGPGARWPRATRTPRRSGRPRRTPFVG